MRVFSSKRRTKVLGLGLVTGLAVSAVAIAAVTFGPVRPTFTWANPAPYITFNSITDNPQWGDERQLIKARDLNSPTTAYSTSTQVTDGEDVVLAVFFHNNAASNLNLTATNTQVKFSLPGTSATILSPEAFISADNANPNQVFATADLTNSRPFTITYEPGTAKLYTNYVNGIQVSDNVVTSGTLIGSGGTDGRVPGCAQFSGFVTIRVKVHVTPSPQVSFACTELDVTQIDRTRFDFTAHATVQNANVTSYAFTAKNSGGSTVDTNTVNTSALSAVYHFNQSAPGTYTVSAVVNTDHGSTSASACTKQITVASVPPTPTPPATVLPNTGAGDVLGIFTGVSSLGAAGHYVVNRRRR